MEHANDAEATGSDSPQTFTERVRMSAESRRVNIERLRALRRKLDDDLQGTLAWVRELATMIHLAKHTGAPASRAQELVTQIAAAVEGLTEVSAWSSESHEGPLVTERHG